MSKRKRLHDADGSDSDDEIKPEKKHNIFTDKCTAYKASGIKSSLHGTIYQLKLLMVFIVRGLKNDYKFRLATEIDAAGQFDDLVFQYQSGNSIASRFLQAKHKQDETKLISFSDLINEQNDDFSLQKYFKSYRLIKENSLEFEGHLKDFILCTNIDLDYDGLEGNGVKVDKISEKGDFFLSNDTSSMKYRLRVDEKSDLFKKIRECSRIYSLARALVSHIKESKQLTLQTEDFKLYHQALVTENVVDIKSKKFHDKFIKSDPSLSESAIKLRNIIEERFRKAKDLTIAKAKLTFSTTFGIGYKSNQNPQIESVQEFAIELAELIKNTINSGKNTVKVERRRNAIKTNIDKLAGHVIVKKLDENVFSTTFLDMNTKLCGNLDEFRVELKNALKGHCNFTSLNHLTFDVTDFHNEPPLALPSDKIEDDEINEFFEKFTFAVKQPNETELSKIIAMEMGDHSEFNLLDGSLLADSFEIQMLDWFKAKRGIWITTESAQQFLNSIQQKITALISIGCNSYIETLQSFEMSYERENECLTKFLTDEDNSDLTILNFISTDDTLLGSIKVFQSVSAMPMFKKSDSYIFLCLSTLSLFPETGKRVLTTFSSSTSTALLIIECNDNVGVEIDQLVKDILDVRRGKKLILISQENHSLPMKFATRQIVHHHENSFKHLSAKSQSIILDKSVKFQGIDLQLKMILTGDASTIDAIISSKTLVKLIKNYKLSIYKELQIFTDYNKLNYIERILYSSSKLVRKVSDKNVYDQVEQDYSEKPLPYRVFIGSWGGTYVQEIVLPDEKFVKRQYEEVSKNLLLVADEPGNGKTTILYRFYELIKRFFPYHLIFLIRFNNYTKILKPELTEIPQKLSKRWALELLLKMLKCDKSYTQFEINYIKHCLEHTNKISLLFDGFDEICPDFQVLITGLIGELTKTKIAKVWVTTRSILRDNLEKKFRVTAVALTPLDLQDQIRFLQNLLCADSIPSENQKTYAEKYANALIEKFVSAIRDNGRKFTGSPLQLKMLASVFKQRFSEEWQRYSEDTTSEHSEPMLPANLKLNDLYESFIAEKCRIYSNEKSTQLSGNVASKRESDFYLNHALASHEQLAFYELFSDEKVEPLQFQTYDEILDSIEKIGIVQKINDNFRFIHTTFAEYLVAKNLANKLGHAPRGKHLDVSALKFLINEIFLQPHNEGVRSFLDGFLNERSIPENVYKECGKALLDLKEVCLANSPLHLACSEKNISIIYFMVNSLTAVDKNTELLKCLIELKNNAGCPVLYKAAEMGNLELISFLKNIAHADPNATDNEDNTVLMRSVMFACSFDVIRSLGGDVNAVNADEESVLFKAAEMGNLQVVEYLIEKWANVNFACCGVTVLHNAIHSGNLDVIKCLVRNGANVDAVDDEGNSVLHYAAYSGYLEICTWLVDKDGGKFSNIYIQSKDGSSILHEAALSGNLELCRWLVEELCLSIECKDDCGRTALFEACKYNNFTVAEWLVKVKNASVNSVDNDGNTLLTDAAKYGDSKLCQWLIGQGLNANATDSKGRTILKIATEYGNLELLQWLTGREDYNAVGEIRELQAKVLILPLTSEFANHEMKWMLAKNSKASKWVGPDGISRQLRLKHRNDDEEIVLHLVAKGANINAQTESGQTILHHVISNGNTDLAKKLIVANKKQIDFTLRDENHKTALDVAKDKDEGSLVRFFEELII